MKTAWHASCPEKPVFRTILLLIDYINKRGNDMKTTTLFAQMAALGVIGVMASGTVAAADPAKINWSKIPVTNIPLFYPGQSTYEWVRSDAHKGASKEVK